MMNFEGFQKLVSAIEALGYEKNVAADFASFIGDTPLVDEDGKVVVQDPETGAILARLALPDFGFE